MLIVVSYILRLQAIQLAISMHLFTHQPEFHGHRGACSLTYKKNQLKHERAWLEMPLRLGLVRPA